MIGRLKFEITDLVNEILDQIPQDLLIHGKVFDPAMGGGQFVREVERRKRAAGLTDQQITATVFGMEQNLLRKNYAVNKHSLVGTYVVGDFLTTEFEHKFDVVISNPPYQDTDDSGGALWSRIVGRVFEHSVADQGWVAMIHPPSFVGKQNQTARGKSDYSPFAKNQILQLHLLDDAEKNRYFAGIGTRVCWYVARRQPATQVTRIVGYDLGKRHEHQIDFPSTTFLPTEINSTSMSIHKKLLSATGLDFVQSRQLHYHTMKRRGTISDTQSNDYCYKTYFSHKLIRYASVQGQDYAAIKLMVPQTSTIDNALIDQNCNVSEDLFYIVCDTWNQADAIKTYLKSDVVTYIGKNYRPGRNLGSLLSAGLIPQPQQVPNFTKKELDYIKTFG